MPDLCAPEKASCDELGFTWSDWWSSIHKRLCAVIQWMAGVYDNTKIAPYGTVQLFPVHSFVVVGTLKTVAVPAGAVSINAIIDTTGGSTYQLSVQRVGETSFNALPNGVDFTLDSTPNIQVADINGKNCTRGTGIYPGYNFQFPAGCKGVVIAVFLDSTKTLVQS